jgi:ornithine cyclodeaminase/alanine dehydrogenase-like protein (mu-crystallin family)
MQIRLLNAAAVRALLPVDQCIGLARQAMKLVATEGGTIQPIRQALFHPDKRGLMSMMPGYTANPEWLGIKVMSVYPGNFGTQYGSHQGFVILFETGNGIPRAIMDGREITAIRTAAATAAGTDALARRDTRTLAIFGYGEQAHTHLEAVPKVRAFERALVWGRDFEKTRAFCAAEQAHHPFEIVAVQTAKEAAIEADVLCTTTAAREPFFEADWLRPGQHLNVVGSSVPTTSEIDVQTVARCRLFVDFKESALALAGDFRRAREAGVVGDDHILGSIGDVLTGRVAGRTSDQDITLFKSLGMVSEDLVSADFILAEAERLSVGQLVEW